MLSALGSAVGLIAGSRRYFANGANDPEALAKRARIMARPAPNNTFVVFFTPRSGSTRVTSLMREAGVSNAPHELFNPATLRATARNHAARNLPELVRLLAHKQARQGSFGFEITFLQLAAVFRTPSRFMALVAPDHTAWLIREDIVAQAVSASRLVQTRISHGLKEDEATHAAAEAAFVYDPGAIRARIRRIAWMERRTEAMITRAGLTPLRLSYEAVNALGPDRTAGLLAHRLGLAPPAGALADRHQKLPGAKSAEYAERFRGENPAFMRRLDRVRAPLLHKLRSETRTYS